jgi:hypothetical protein
MNHRYYVRPFGGDCYGNCTGWQVVDAQGERATHDARRRRIRRQHLSPRAARSRAAKRLCELFNKKED